MHTAIGIDFGGTTIKPALVKDGAIISKGRVIETQQCSGPDEIIDELSAVIVELRSLPGGEAVEGVGIGLPGIINVKTGIVRSLTNVPGWSEVPLQEILQDRARIPVVLENDANAMAYAEYRHGAAKGSRNAVCITLGTGVGGGLILEGKPYRGSNFGAGELGHATIQYEAAPGPAGVPGELELFVGNRQFAARAKARYSELGQSRTAEECTLVELQRLADQGDVVSIELWEEYGTHVGFALVNVVWLLNPDAIVIGGGISKAGERLFSPIRRTLEKATLPSFREGLRIVPAALGNDAGAIGCAELAIMEARSRAGAR
jgi:glucokinase